MDPLAELEEISERGEKGGVNFIPCLKWVQRGVAKANPDKVSLLSYVINLAKKNSICCIGI
jgi:hypothetical protein